jgi:hypothetical protein
MRHRLVIATALLLALAGCSDDSPAPKASASTTPATASPSPSGPVAPVLPSAAKANTPVGAKAFARYWFEAISYAMKTGDTKPFDAVAGAHCKPCDGISSRVRRIYGPGGRLSGGGWTPRQLDLDPYWKGAGYRLAGSIRQAPQKLINEHGKVASQTPEQVYVVRVLVIWTKSGWRTSDLEQVR